MSLEEHNKSEAIKLETGSATAWENTALYVATGLVVLLCIIIRLRLLDIPLERDEGEFAYIGQLILKGIPPFDAAYSMKLPGAAGMYALIMTLFGQTAQGIHQGLLVANLVTTGLVFMLGKRVCNVRAGSVAAAAHALLSVSFSVLGVFAHATHFVVLFAMAGFVSLFAALDREKLLLALVSGLLFGLAFTMKQHAALLIVFAFLYFAGRIWNASASGRKRVVAGSALFLFGVMVPYALLALWMFKAGLFERFWFWTVQYAREYTSSEPLAVGLGRLLTQTAGIMSLQLPLWLIAVAGAALLLTKQGSSRDRFFLFGLFFFSLLAICPGFYFRPHYYIMLLPVAALLIGVAFQSATFLTANFKPGIFRQIIPLCLFMCAVAYGFVSERSNFFTLSPERVSRATYTANPFPEAVEVARYIREHTSPHDRIAVLGSEPEIYFYSGRLSATGHIYMYGLMEIHDFAERMQMQMIREIESVRPKYVVVVNVDASWVIRPASSQKILEWGENYVRTFYELVGIIDIIDSTTTRYMWDDKTAGYAPVSTAILTVFKRRG